MYKSLGGTRGRYGWAGWCFDRNVLSAEEEQTNANNSERKDDNDDEKKSVHSASAYGPALATRHAGP